MAAKKTGKGSANQIDMAQDCVQGLTVPNTTMIKYDP